jgi:serine/threonine protein kinase
MMVRLPSGPIDATGLYVPEGDVTQRPTRPHMTESPGQRIGPYTLLELLGEGGMGAVYLAEQTEPVRRQVALKLIKSGMDSAQVVARFQAELQALALMDHVNIAKVLDARSTESGQPYFVWNSFTVCPSRPIAMSIGSRPASGWNCSFRFAWPCNMPTRNA